MSASESKTELEKLIGPDAYRLRRTLQRWLVVCGLASVAIVISLEPVSEATNGLASEEEQQLAMLGILFPFILLPAIMALVAVRRTIRAAGKYYGLSRKESSGLNPFSKEKFKLSLDRALARKHQRSDGEQSP